MQFVVESFEYAKGLGNNLEKRGADMARIPGADIIGYFPEFVNSPRMETSEICEVSDMIAVALLLSEQGAGDYWDDADRWIRNMLAEGQLLSTNWIPNILKKRLMKPDSIKAKPWDDGDNVLEKIIGSFASWPTANEWYIGHGPGIMQCCTENGARVLYWIWERILTFSGQNHNGKLKVNLLLNRASPWADVESFIPYQGRVDVKVKVACDLSLRIPEWASPDDVRCSVKEAKGETERSLSFDGRYAQVGKVNPENTATLTFPIEEKSVSVLIEKQGYTLAIKGNEVVSIDPPGHICPLFQREHYRESTPRRRKTTRFVSEEQIEW